MRVNAPPISLYSQLTVDGDIDLLDLYQVKNLALPASGEALRKGSKDIANAEVADAAAIGYAKLALTGLIKAADIKAAAGIPYSKLTLTGLVRDADVKSDAAVALSKLASAVYTETESDGLITTHAAIAAAHHTAVTIATGTYSGTGSSKQVATGFKCSKVIIVSANELNTVPILITSYTTGITGQTNNFTEITSTCYLHASDGFQVGTNGNDGNGNGYTYYYWAISE